jgi:hypothetical protein
MKRVWVTSPPSRTAVATGNESAARTLEGDPAAHAVAAQTTARSAQRTAWTGIAFHPIEPLLLH